MEGGVEYSSQKFLALYRYEGYSTLEEAAAAAAALADAEAAGPACGEGEVSSGPEIEKGRMPLTVGGGCEIGGGRSADLARWLAVIP